MKNNEENTNENTEQLCSVFCPNCNKVINKISFNLLREAKNVEVTCTRCASVTYLEYNGKKVSIWHH